MRVKLEEIVGVLMLCFLINLSLHNTTYLIVGIKDLLINVEILAVCNLILKEHHGVGVQSLAT